MFLLKSNSLQVSMWAVALAYSLYLTCAVAFPFYENTTNVWAVLVAGTYGYENYRHQADVAHAYNLLLSKGVAPERIITFFYNDIVYNVLNPYPGVLHNDYYIVNYYENVTIDYSDRDVTKTNFLSALEGDPVLKAKGYKVLESGENDNVFIYYSGLGNEQFIDFPDDFLFAQELNSTLSFLYVEKKYSKLVFYLDSSLSGSMFENVLSADINAYAVTASSSKEDSFAIFCEDYTIGVCLADEFSYNWITDSEQFDLTTRTLEEQFTSVKNNTQLSTVERFGDLTIAEYFLSDFQGEGGNNSLTFDVDSSSIKEVNLRETRQNSKDATSSVKQGFVKRQLNHASKLVELATETIQLVVDMVSTKPPSAAMLPVTMKEEHDCFRAAMKAFSKHCYSRHRVPEIVKQSGKLAQLCKRGYSSATIASAIKQSCL